MSSLIFQGGRDYLFIFSFKIKKNYKEEVGGQNDEGKRDKGKETSSVQIMSVYNDILINKSCYKKIKTKENQI